MQRLPPPPLPTHADRRTPRNRERLRNQLGMPALGPEPAQVRGAVLRRSCGMRKKPHPPQPEAVQGVSRRVLRTQVGAAVVRTLRDAHPPGPSPTKTYIQPLATQQVGDPVSVSDPTPWASARAAPKARVRRPTAAQPPRRSPANSTFLRPAQTAGVVKAKLAPSAERADPSRWRGGAPQRVHAARRGRRNGLPSPTRWSAHPSKIRSAGDGA